jgi:hypothetical protein
MTWRATSFRDGLYVCDRYGKTSAIPDAQGCSSYFLTWHSCAACTRCRPGSQQSGSLSLYWPCLSAFLRSVGTRSIASSSCNNRSSDSRQGGFPYGEDWADAINRVPTDHTVYFSTRVQMPAPTVRPPSRMANLTPSSMATGWISSTVISMLSPGMTISTPSGSLMAPVTSVVRT